MDEELELVKSWLTGAQRRCSEKDYHPTLDQIGLRYGAMTVDVGVGGCVSHWRRVGVCRKWERVLHTPAIVI